MAALTTVPDVELATVGVWYTSTGVWECTAEQLADAVRAQDDPTFRTPVLKVGHEDERFNASADGEPGVGRVTNLRLSADGLTLLGDLTGVPAWLAEILPSAYPSRSVEMVLDVVTAAGQTYAGVLTGLALLGVSAPAIESLADVAALYEQPTAVDAWVAARAVAASLAPVWPASLDLSTPMTTVHAAPTFGGAMPTTTPPAPPSGRAWPPTETGHPVRAAASIESLRVAFYDWVQGQDGDAEQLDRWSWICEVWTDAIIADDDDGQLWRVPWTETTGVFTFGAPAQVTRTYVPVADTVVARASAGMHRPLWRTGPTTPGLTVPAEAGQEQAVRSARGREIASAASPEETPSVSDTPTAVGQLRERLGLGPDVPDDEVLAAAVARLASETPPEPDPDHTDTADAADVADVATPEGIERLVAARVAAAVRPFETQLTAATTELAARREADRVTRRETVIAGAVATGRITPADRDRWARDFDEAPAVIERVLASIAPGTAMPVTPSGTVGVEPGASSDDDAFYASIYGTPKAGA